MAVVLLLFGVVMGGGLLGFAAVNDQYKDRITQERFDLALDALSVYAQRHKRLPCPADADGNGGERLNGLCFDNSSEAGLYAGTQGILPWRDLGLPETAVRDGWGRYITYKPAPHLTVNYLSDEMQNRDPATTSLDVHDACRSASWFTTGDDSSGMTTHSHLDRAKALFCCNRAPNTNYLSNFAAGGTLPAGWKNQSVVAAGVVNNNSLTGKAVQITHAWMDDIDNAALEINGDFDVPDHGDTADASPDTPLQRAMGQAVTLISHGGNGYLSFLRGADNNTRLQGNIDGAGNVSPAANLAPDEMISARYQLPDQSGNVAGTAFHPKSWNAYDRQGRRDGATDDRVAFQRTDQLFSRLGSATCLRPANAEPPEQTCPPSGLYGDVTYVLDTSGSMQTAFNGGNLGRTRIDVAKNALQLVVPDLIQQEIDGDTEDPDMVGFNYFDSNGPNFGCGVQFDEKIELYDGFDSNADGVLDDNDVVDQTILENASVSLVNRIGQATSWGNTPLAQTIRTTADAMADDNGDNGSEDEPNAIVFISDGADTCGGNILNTAHYIAQTYPNLVVHIIDVGDTPSLAQMHDPFTVVENGQPVEHRMQGNYIKVRPGNSKDIVDALRHAGGSCSNS